MHRRSRLFFSGICVSLLAGACVLPAALSQTPFSQDSAYAHLRVLAGEIGPRPMGSPAERKAMDYAVAKFREFGLDEAFVMPIRETVSGVAGGSVNTNTGIAVGVLHGSTKRIIVLGGHIDSANPDIPGANDDGSGSAAIIELARVLRLRNGRAGEPTSQRANGSTIVFALFGGEEHGLRGSRHFVRHFDRIDSVFLMLQIDMANGSEWLLPLVDAGDVSSPEWLVRASYEELDKLGYPGFSFPTHFYSLLEFASEGGIGSDHEPFLERNIPAIDFTTDVTDPIHTPQDNLQNFKPDGLKRSGDLVYRLVERFDGGVPGEATDQYYLLQWGPVLLFVPPLVLTMFVIVALGAAVYSLVMLRKRRTIEGSPAKIPGLKLFFLMVIIQTCVWLSENIVGLIKGQRFPWMSEPDGYFILGLFAGIAGIWICLQFAARLDLTKIPYRYALRSVVILVLFLALFSLVSVKLAVYPAVSMMLLSLAFLLSNRYARLLVWVVSGHFMYRLIFSDGFLLLARTLTQVPAEGGASFYLHIFYILFFSLWSFPFLLAFAALYYGPGDPMPWMRSFAKPAGGIVTGSIVAAWIFYLSTVPAYTELWKQPIDVRQSFDLARGKVILSVSSPDFLDGASVRVGGKDTLITGRETSVRLEDFDASSGEWVRVERSVESRGDSNTTFDIRLWIHAQHRPYRLKVTYAGGSGIPTDVTTPLVWSPGSNSISFEWYSFPDTALFLPVSFTVTGSDSVKEYIEATFLEQPVEVFVNKELSSVSSRTVVANAEVLRGAK